MEIFYFLAARFNRAMIMRRNKKIVSDEVKDEDLKNMLSRFDRNFKELFLRVDRIEKNFLKVEDT